MRRIRRAVTVALLSSGLFAGSLAFSSTSALGFLLHPYLSQITEANGKPLLLPWGLAFDPSGNLLVVDHFEGALDVFNPSDVFTAQSSLGGEIEQPSGMGISDTTGAVYVGEVQTLHVYKPEGGGKYREAESIGFRGVPFVKVDNSSGPHAGDLYVFNGGLYLVKPNAAGELLAPAEGLLPPPEGFSSSGEGGGLAVDGATGEVYVSNPEHGVVDKYNPHGEYEGKVSGPPGFQPKGLAVEESTGDLYAVDGANNVVDQFNAAGEYIGGTAETPAGPLSEPEDVAVSSSGHVYVSTHVKIGSGEVYLGSVEVFGPSVFAPFVATGAANGIARTTAKLEGVVNPEGKAVTSCEFEYGTSTAYGQTAACAPAPGSGSSPVNVSAEVSGLTPGTTYHYRVVAKDSTGTNQGASRTFGTFAVVPGLQTEAASAIEEPAAGEILATLNGSLEPDGADTHFYFEYGETEAYGSVSPALPGTDAGEAFAVEHAQTKLTGLKPETTYHYRIVATNSFGTEAGHDMTFATPSAVSGVQTEEATNIEVAGSTIAATLNGTLAPNGADTHYYFEYGETNAYGSVGPALPGADAGAAFKLEHVKTTLTGLKPYAVYHFRLIATNAFGTTTGSDLTFNTFGVVPPPVVAGLPASSVSQFTATLNGTLETDAELVNYHFEYGTSTAYGQLAPVPDSYTPITAKPLAVSQPLAGLQAGTTYHYRLVASSPGATEVKGPDETFATLPIPAPTVATGAASGVGVGSVTLNGTIDPHGWDTTYLFQYGPSTAYGQSWPTVQVDMGALQGAQPVIVNVPNLLPGTTYHYRLIATNGGGTTYGPDMTFTTGEYPAAIVQEPVSLRTLLVPTGGETATPSGKQAKKGKKHTKSKRKVRRKKRKH